MQSFFSCVSRHSRLQDTDYLNIIITYFIRNVNIFDSCFRVRCVKINFSLLHDHETRFALLFTIEALAKINKLKKVVSKRSFCTSSLREE